MPRYIGPRARGSGAVNNPDPPYPHPPQRLIIYGGPPSTIDTTPVTNAAPSVPRVQSAPSLQSAPSRVRALEASVLAPMPVNYRHAILELEAETARVVNGSLRGMQNIPATVQNEAAMRRRARIDDARVVRGAAPRAASSGGTTRLLRRIDPNSPAALGWRKKRDTALKETDLYKNGICPADADQPEPKPHQKCAICRCLKSHPVSYVCGHSHCYACIRLWLEREFTCPECVATMYRAPFRNYAEEQAIRADFPDWSDKSEVDYSWRGLRFPRPLHGFIDEYDFV